MKKLNLILFLILLFISPALSQVLLDTPPQFLELKNNTNPLQIEYKLGLALNALNEGNFQEAISNLNQAFLLQHYFNFKDIPSFEMVHLSAAYFILHVLNFEKIPNDILNSLINYWNDFLDSGEGLSPYEQVVSINGLQIIKLTQEGKFQKALEKVNQALDILDNTSFFNFSIEKYFLQTVKMAFILKKFDLLILIGKIKEAQEWQKENFSEFQKLLTKMDEEANKRFQTLNPGIIFLKGRNLEDFFFYLSFMKLRSGKLKEGRKILNEGLKYFPDSQKLKKMSYIFKEKK